MTEEYPRLMDLIGHEPTIDPSLSRVLEHFLCDLEDVEAMEMQQAKDREIDRRVRNAVEGHAS